MESAYGGYQPAQFLKFESRHEKTNSVSILYFGELLRGVLSRFIERFLHQSYASSLALPGVRVKNLTNVCVQKFPACCCYLGVLLRNSYRGHPAPNKIKNKTKLKLLMCNEMAI